jgi:hypothetical protein
MSSQTWAAPDAIGDPDSDVFVLDVDSYCTLTRRICTYMYFVLRGRRISHIAAQAIGRYDGY